MLHNVLHLFHDVLQVFPNVLCFMSVSQCFMSVLVFYKCWAEGKLLKDKDEGYQGGGWRMFCRWGGIYVESVVVVLELTLFCIERV